MKNPKFHIYSKYIAIQNYFVRKKITEKEIDLQYIPISKKIANNFTKSLSKTNFLQFREALGLR